MELTDLLAAAVNDYRNQLVAERARADYWQNIANQRTEEIIRLQQEIQDLKDEAREETPE